MKRKASYLLDSLLLLGLCLVFFWRDLTPMLADRWAFEPGDFAQQFYAFAHYEAARWQGGQVPLWNPYNFAGHPFLADIQAAIFYPISLLSMLVTAAGRFSYRALELEALIHYPLAAIFTYLLARRLTGSRVGGLVAAITFTFGGYLTSYPPLQLAILETQVWLPLLLLCLDVAADRLEHDAVRPAVRWAALAGLVFGVSLLAGHPQAALLVGYAGLGYWLFRVWPQPFRREWRWWRRPLGLLLLWGLIGVGVAAVQLLPSAEFMALSVRSGIGFDEAGRGFQPYDYIQMIYPAIGGRFAALYFGLLPLGLAAFALVAVRRDRATSPAARRTIEFLGWVVLLAVLISLGKIFGLYQFLYLFAPGWRLFRGQERVIAWAALALALLAGYGAGWLSQRWAASRAGRPAGDADATENWLHPRSAEGWLAWGFGLAAVIALVFAGVFFVQLQSGRDAAWGFTSASVYLALFLALAALALRSRRPALLIAVLFLDLLTYNPSYHAVPLSSLDLTPLRDLLAEPLADSSLFRIKNDDVLPIGFGLLYNLEDIGGPSPLHLKQYEEWLKRLPPDRAWRLLNVKYVASWQQFLDLPSERIAEAPGLDQDKKPVYLYRVLDPLPRAWLTGRVTLEPDMEKTYQLLAAADFDPAQQVVLASQPDGFAASENCGGGESRLDWRRRDPEHLALRAAVDSPCVLVLSELLYPGWRAAVDGQAAPILRADGILRGLVLPAGEHEVTFDYRPLSVSVGAVISVLTLALAAGLLVWGGRKNRS